MTFADIRNKLDIYERLIRLDKPVGFMLLMWPTLWGLWIAASGEPDVRLVLIFVVGTILMRSAGCAINDWADRDFDGAVKRTAQRPLAAGEISGREALAVGAVCVLLAACLLIPLNWPGRLWAIPALIIAAIYPFTKRFFAVPQAILGIAFSMGIPMAFAVIDGRVPAVAWYLVAANFFWVMAFDTEYAMVDRDDDLKLGIRTSAIFFGRFDVWVIALCYALFIVGMLFVANDVESGPWYYAGLGVAALIALYHLWLIRGRDRMKCFAAFRGNNWFGLAVFAGVAADYVARFGNWPRLFV
ncbi:MAG: 4-hydroxybenzoate octaprenyltransferase [Burkholderiales bacterium]|nr:4-hydroxybenzoate octaprenyltransferase [Burkholderiales bacterium]